MEIQGDEIGTSAGAGEAGAHYDDEGYAMSVEAMSWAFSVALPPCPKSVLVALANRADEDGQCWPGVEDLERRTGWSRRAVQGAVRRLIAYGLLALDTRHTGSGRQQSNLYRLAIGSRPMVLVEDVEGAGGAPPRVQEVHPEGAGGAPESSSEPSEESSLELCRRRRATGGRVVKSARAWEGYRAGYRRRYGVDPVRDARVNADLCRLVDGLGDEAGPVAEFYVGHDRALYVQAGHVTTLLVRDYQALRMQWKTCPIRAPVTSPMAYRELPRTTVARSDCPTEAADALSKILGREAFRFSCAGDDQIA